MILEEMNDEQLATACLGALALLVALMLEAADRLNEPEQYQQVTRVDADVVVLEETEESRHE